MRAYDLAYGAPEPLSAEEIAELENVLPVTLEGAYAEGRKDEREQWTDLRMSQFLSDVVTAAGLLHHGKADKGLAKRISDKAYELMQSHRSPEE